MTVQTAYTTCAEITRSEARNFSYGIRLLPPTKRRAMSAIYAAARRIDDIGDGDLPAAQKSLLLAKARDDLHRVHKLEGARPDHVRPDHVRPDRHGLEGDPVLVALADAAGRLPIPVEAFDELIDGCEADVAGRPYRTFDELVGYCRCVAGSIGRLSVGVYDPPDREQALPLADMLGVALQLTNILRDVREDRLAGRVYLPQEDLVGFGCSLDLDQSGFVADPPERFAALIRFEAERARRWYAEGLTLLPLLDHRSAACTAAMAGIYRRLLERIAADPEPVRHERLSLSTGAKLRVAARALTWGRT